MLGFIEKMTLQPESLTVDDAVKLREAGISKEAMKDAIGISFMFNLMDRLADSFKYYNPDDEFHRKTGVFLLKRGYKM